MGCDRIAASALGLLLAAGSWPLPSLAFAHAEVGDPVPRAELPALGGGSAPLVVPGKVSLFVFFRPSQDRSLETLRHLAALEKEFAGKPVYFAAVASDAAPAAEVRATAREAGIRMTVLLDRGDALYGELGVRLHPVVGIADAQGRLAAYQPYASVNHAEVMRARIRRALGEIDDAELARVLDPPSAAVSIDAERAAAGRELKLGRMLLERKSYDKALESARRALARDRSLAAAHLLAGQALAGLGRCDEARRELDEALRLDPGNAAAAEARRACGG